MFTEILAAHVLDPASECPCGRDDHRRTNCPDDFRGGTISGDMPSKAPSVNHLIRKSINGKRITLHHVRPDGKGHYIGPPGVAVDIGQRVQWRPTWPGDVWQPTTAPVCRSMLAPDQNDVGRKAP